MNPVETTNWPDPAVSEDPRVTRALEEYLAALEAGRRPERQEFLARHADIADALAGCLAGLELMHSGAPHLRPPAASLADLTLGTPLGDFRLVREVGRGGMGIVYEAEQLSLKRKVALKVLPLASALDPKQLRRFQHEAAAAAQLHHTNIVPVYAVGCERGVHYYAMQYIDGQSLAAVIARLRPSEPRPSGGGEPPAPPPDGRGSEPATVAALTTERSASGPAFFRTVAQLGVQAAEALEYAHQQGVIHRDVKPANLLLDGRGHLWVADFGLARLQNDETRMTQTGDLVGTLRYMSPEQASARRGLVDQRADVYGLGATLYELLTLEPACPGRDREEILHRLAWEEPRPPRRLNRLIPADLQTVVLKALERRPEDRYATAGELADDLKRFLEDRPVLARPPTLSQRAAKWVRRHRVMVGAAAAVLLVAAVALGVSTALIWAKHQEVVEERNQKEAQRRAAQQNAEQARQQQTRAQQNLWQALHTLDGYIAVLDAMHADPEKQQEAAARLDTVARSLRSAAEDNEGEPTAWYQAARAYHRFGAIQRKLGQPAEAEKALRRAVALLGQSVRLYESSDDFRRQLQETAPKTRSLVLNVLPGAPAPNGPRPAPTTFQSYDNAGPPEFARELADCRHELGQALRELGRPALAAAEHRRALDLLGRPGDEHGDAPQYLRRSAEYRLGLGLALEAAGRPEEAGPVLRECPTPWEELARQFPDAARWPGPFAYVYRDLGRRWEAAGRPAEAARAYREALAAYGQIERPANPQARAAQDRLLEELRRALERAAHAAKGAPD